MLQSDHQRIAMLIAYYRTWRFAWASINQIEHSATTVNNFVGIIRHSKLKVVHVLRRYAMPAKVKVPSCLKGLFKLCTKQTTTQSHGAPDVQISGPAR